uniref:Uncharacterized protein n=1 Tax=Anguilla anguilla TaxID=7936 RepID=A0A0E9WSD1_ANGAN
MKYVHRNKSLSFAVESHTHEHDTHFVHLKFIIKSCSHIE